MSKFSSSPLDYLRFLLFAWEGIRYCLAYHRSFLIEIIIGLLAITAGIFLRLTRVEWLILVLAIFLVLAAELLNTAIEATLDYMATEHHIDVKVAKDVAAGGVLVTAIAAVVIGVIIFVPYLLIRW